MYFSNLFLSMKLTKSLKKNFAIMYNNKAPIEIEIVEIKVPTHVPNRIPDNISIGEPKPKRIIQNIVNKKNKNKLKAIFLPI